MGDLSWVGKIEHRYADLYEGDFRIANIFMEQDFESDDMVIVYSLPSSGLLRERFAGDDFQEAMKFVEAQYILSRGE